MKWTYVGYEYGFHRTAETAEQRWRNKFIMRPGAFFMQRTKCPLCCIDIYVWEKSDLLQCVCGANLKRM